MTSVDAAIDFESHHEYEASELSDRERFLRWLTRHDPLPFFSALCVLVGIWLIAGDLGSENWLRGKLWLHAVTHAYELCLVAGAALLFRAGRFRSAAILALLEGAFLLDPVFNTAVMPHLESFAWWSSALWLGLALGKVMWLAKVFRLRIAASVWALAVGCAALISLIPQILDDVSSRTAASVHVSSWLLLCGLLAIVLRTHGGSQLVLFGSTDESPDSRIQRCGSGLVLFWTLLMTCHFLSWLAIFNLEVTLLHLLAPALIILVGAPSTAPLWLASSWVAILLAHDSGSPERMLAALAAVTLAARAWELRRPRLLAPAIFGLGWALYAIPWLAGPGEPLLATAVVAGWIYVAVRFREPLSAACAGLALFAGADEVALSRLGWGMVAIASGFVALATGVWLQLNRKDPGSATAPNA